MASSSVHINETLTGSTGYPVQNGLSWKSGNSLTCSNKRYNNYLYKYQRADSAAWLNANGWCSNIIINHY